MDDPTERLVVEKVVEGGAGLARGQSGVVLIPGTLPQEEIDAQILEAKAGVRRGRILRVVSPSPARMAPLCPLFLSCGGCDFLHTPYERELELKQQILAETLERIGKLKPNFLPPVPAPAPEFYRTFVQLKIDPEGRIGLFRRDSHDVVPFQGAGFQGCRLQNDRINQIVERLQGHLRGYQVINLRMGDVGFVVNLTSEHPTEPNEGLLELSRDAGTTGFLVNDRLVMGDPAVLYIYGEADERKLRVRVSHDAFFQADPSVVQRVAKRVGEIIETKRGPDRLKENLLDLYAGVGTFGILLAHKVLGVFCVEIAKNATHDLEWNMSENRVTNLIFHRGTAKSFLKRFQPMSRTSALAASGTLTRTDIGVCLVDPPRAGVDVETRKELLRLSPPLLIYLSCDPPTLARDLADFAAGGYEIDSVQIFDQFGRTHHIESLSVLKKISSTPT